jgi:serine/threonine-protein kinase
MNISNVIESQYRLLNGEIDLEYKELYETISEPKLREILTTLHARFVHLFRRMNERLPTNEYPAHFWADPSRSLLVAIDIARSLYKSLKGTAYAIEIDPYYSEIFEKCLGFLSDSGGSSIPEHMERIELYYTIPIFTPGNSIVKKTMDSELSYPLKIIGEGSYAIVYRYKDDFYNRFFVLKRAKKDLNAKEIMRFKQEYDEMNNLCSPYIVDVFKYDEKKNEYIMECMDYTLYDYIQKNNDKLSQMKRKSFVQQIFKAFSYIHSKQRLHRDISPKNILIKEYEDTIVVKVSDFGLVKTPDSTLTSMHTKFKGWFNDPSLVYDGFTNYNILHEIYALTLLVFFTMTGRTNYENINNEAIRKFVTKGINSEKALRFQNIDELHKGFNSVSMEIWN